MADDLEISIDTRALDEVLSSLPLKVQKKIVGKALQAAGDVVLVRMKVLCPERVDEPTPDSTSLPPGMMRMDLQTAVNVSESHGAEVRIGPGQIAGHVARWVNNGWNLTRGGRRRVRKDGRAVGRGKVIKTIPGQHFIEAALDEAGQAAVDTMVSVVAEELANVNH